MTETIKGLVLAVDDEPNNLRILKFHLERDGYQVITAKDGMEAWDIIQKRYKEIDLLLLDRMMPNMDGMELLRRIKNNLNMKNIPVIMQTAAAEKNQVLEGIKAGVHHYLAKPFSQEVLLSIVGSTIKKGSLQANLTQEIQKQKKTLEFIKKCELEFKTLQEAQEVAAFLSNFYPNPEKVTMGIAAILLNAVEHGNLGISYEEKSEFLKYGNWTQEVKNIQERPENANKKVLVWYENKGNEITLRVKDEGKGFDWQKYMEIDPDRVTDSHGRGIALSRIESFDEIEYTAPGNEVLCKVTLNQAQNKAATG